MYARRLKTKCHIASIRLTWLQLQQPPKARMINHPLNSMRLLTTCSTHDDRQQQTTCRRDRNISRHVWMWRMTGHQLTAYAGAVSWAEVN